MLYLLGENNSSRRPIPISTTDWVSTPRSQLTALSGTHFLAGVEQLEIQRIINLNGLLGLSGTKKQYRVKVPKAETIFLAMESRADNKDINRIANLTLILLDQAGETAFVIKKNPVWKYMPGPVHKMTIESTILIGSVEQNFSILGPSFTVYDASRKPLCYIYGPNVSSCCMYKESQFQIISIDGSHQIASLMHQWNNTIHDYTFLLTFPLDLDIKLKSLLLGASFLMVPSKCTLRLFNFSFYTFIIFHQYLSFQEHLYFENI
ncbi:PREDICTED: phospholipid scramblase 1-like [Polistes dominula]|uniref:Phospholipid scramblase n=1 Tax=Polistes dominula TaxID=743375 RepID=A0ABM1J9L8_POLDO|nr:PREDICTED: phospholipid scramblase 1-like [Polistes dominula]